MWREVLVISDTTPVVISVSNTVAAIVLITRVIVLLLSCCSPVEIDPQSISMMVIDQCHSGL